MELSLTPFSLFGTLVLKHLGIFLKDDSILQSCHKVPLHEIQQQLNNCSMSIDIGKGPEKPKENKFV